MFNEIRDEIVGMRRYCCYRLQLWGYIFLSVMLQLPSFDKKEESFLHCDLLFENICVKRMNMRRLIHCFSKKGVGSTSVLFLI